MQADYQKFLGRADELAYWVGQFAHHGLTNEDVVTGFVSSDEYCQRATGG